MWTVLNRIFQTSELLLATSSTSRSPMDRPWRADSYHPGTATWQFAADVGNLDPFPKWRATGGIFYAGSTYVCMYVCSQCQMCRLVTRKVACGRDLLGVCRVHGVATYRRRHGVRPSVFKTAWPDSRMLTLHSASERIQPPSTSPLIVKNTRCRRFWID